MKAQQVKQPEYGSSRSVNLSFETAVESARKALAKEGFGILSEIRIDEKLKEKLGVDFRPYVILDACNPPLAYKALQEEMDIGLLLPCNVIVCKAADSGGSIVAAVNAQAMLSVVGGKSALDHISAEVNQHLQRVVEGV